MKNSASRLLKQIIAGLTSMAKSKTLALKSKTSAIKARLIIFSLVKNKKFLMSSISDKFHAVLGHHHSHGEENCYLEEGAGGCSDHQNRAIVLYNNNARTYEALPNPSKTQLVEEQAELEQDGYDDGYYRYDDDNNDGDDDKYPDLTHTLFDSEDLDIKGSVIDLVKNSKEEKGQEFKLEDEIDHVADLFIRKFRRQIILQKQDSLKRQQEILQRGV